jgi:hypothetical protein
MRVNNQNCKKLQIHSKDMKIRLLRYGIINIVNLLFPESQV